MIRLDMHGMDELLKRLEDMPKQIPYAAMTGLNNLAFKIKEAEQEEIRRAFPTARPQTIKNVFVKKATKTNLAAVIHHDQIFPDSWNPGNYLSVQESGGSRAMKPSERRLGFHYVPASKRNPGMMDKYGNIKGGLITMLLSKLGRFGDVSGYSMNSNGKGMGRYANSEFFLADGKHGLPAGVWQRNPIGTMVSRKFSGPVRGQESRYFRGPRKQKYGRPIPWLIKVKGAPYYKPLRFRFSLVAQKVVDTQAVRVFDEAIDKAIRTAR